MLVVLVVLVVLTMGAVAVYRPLRPALAIAVAAGGLRFVSPVSVPDVATATCIDVGQGDAVVLQDDPGSVVVVDGARYCLQETWRPLPSVSSPRFGPMSFSCLATVRRPRTSNG